jgi:site-specific DNA recombinase
MSIVRANHNIRAAIYARVSSEQQEKEGTIESQLETVYQRVEDDGFTVEPQLRFIDNGYSGTTLVRPGLERLRDQAAVGTFDRLYILNPFRFARKYAYQVLVIEELQSCGVEIIFLNHDFGKGPEDNLLLQMQGMIAEYERAKILERSRRGKLHAARKGSVSVLTGAPYGYKYISCFEGHGEASYEINFEEATLMRQIFEWVGLDGYSINEVCRCLHRKQIPTRTGKERWDRSTVWGMLKNPAYKGMAAYGKTRIGEMRPRLRPQRGASEYPRRACSVYKVPEEKRIPIPVPAIVTEELFDAVQERLAENKERNRRRKQGARHLLQGLLVCNRCGYSYYAKPVGNAAAKRKNVSYVYYRCTGSDAYRFGGNKVCSNKQVKSDMLEQAVWEDVCSFLSDPDRIEGEYQRRLTARKDDVKWGGVQHLHSAIGKIKRGISRIIDSYQDGLLEKQEFEPRIRKAKERLKKLETELQDQETKEEQLSSLKLVIGRMKEFAQKVTTGLHKADWATRREIIIAMIKEIKIDEENIQIVYKVSPTTPSKGTEKKNMQHCLRRESRFLCER